MRPTRLNKRYLFMLKWGVPSLAVAGALAVFVAMASQRGDPSAANPDGSVDGLTDALQRRVSDEMVQFTFQIVTDKAGIDFQHFPATRRSLLPEDMGSGLAWGDYDNDGDDDLFLVNFHGSVLDPIPADTPKGRCALYRNDAAGRFADVSRQAGLDIACFGMAAAWGDYDNDDDLDLYLTCYGSNRLLRNNGDGTFDDVTEPAGVGDRRFSAGCAWGDFDRDGNIDLYVTNYVDFQYDPPDRERSSRQFGSEIPYTINPSVYAPAANALYRNNGDGTFKDVAESAGVANPDGRSLGAVWADLDDDGWIDLYVANDVSSNGVYRNRRDGTFEDIGATSLAADYRGAMGLAIGDIDHDADLDLLVTHWVAQENAFFENMWSTNMIDDHGGRRLFFMDNADLFGLGHISLQMVGWATGFADFDNDGHLDLWVVNGHTLEMIDDHTRLRPQQLQLFRQQPPKGFFEIGRRACPGLAAGVVGRGGAHADFDNDGCMDLAVLVHGGRPILLGNRSTAQRQWLGVRLRQAGANTRALGARVTLKAGPLAQTAQVGADGSYLSQSSIDLHFGLGDADQVDELIIRWPDGTTESHRQVRVNHTTTFYRTSP